MYNYSLHEFSFIHVSFSPTKSNDINDIDGEKSFASHTNPWFLAFLVLNVFKLSILNLFVSS